MANRVKIPIKASSPIALCTILSTALTLSLPDCTAFQLCVAFLTLNLSLSLCYLIGLAMFKALDLESIKPGFSIPFLLGLLIFNTFTFLALLSLSHFRIVGIGSLLIAALGVILTAKKRGAAAYCLLTPISRGETFAVCISVIAALFWCQTSIRPWGQDINAPSIGVATIFKPWVDVFYHGAWVQAISRAFSVGYISDLRTVDAPPYFYHAAPYSIPALVSAAAGITGLTCFLSILSPLAFISIGMAGFSLANYFGGITAAITAVIILLLVPSSDILGPQTPWFGFHWLNLTLPSLALGMGGIAPCWILIIEGLKRSRAAPILFGWGLSLMLILTKVHIFVANAPLLFFIPLFKFRPLRLPQRACAITIGASCFCLALLELQHRGLGIYLYDGSAFSWYSTLVAQHIPNTSIRALVFEALGFSNPIFAKLSFAAFVFIASFGAWGILAVLRCTTRKGHDILSLITLGVVGLYIMSSVLGSKSDPKFGNPEEFIHRATVMAYLLCAVSSAVYLAPLIDSLAKRGRHHFKVVFGAIIIILLIFTYSLGRSVERGPGFGLHGRAIPKGIIQAANYMHKNSTRGGVYLSMGRDPDLLISALSGLAPFVAIGANQSFRPSAILNDRLKLAEKLTKASDIEEVNLALTEIKANWVVFDEPPTEAILATLNDKLISFENGLLLLRLR